MRLFVVIFPTFFFFGCGIAPEKPLLKPTYIHPSYIKQPIDSIAVLPTIDGREDRSVNFDFNKEIRAQLASSLIIDKGYAVDFGYEGGPIKFTEEELKGITPQQIKSLGPKGARWILLPMLTHLKAYEGSGTIVAISGYLFDRQQGKMIWSNRGISGSSEGLVAVGAGSGALLGIGPIGVIIGMFVGGLVEASTPSAHDIQRGLDLGVRKLLRGLPKKDTKVLKYYVKESSDDDF